MPLEILDLLGHAFYACLALGMFLLAHKSRWGWAFRFLGEAGWLWIGIEMGMSSIWLWGCIFICMEVYGFWSWSRKHHQ